MANKKLKWSKEQATRNLKDGEVFLAENALRPEIISNISGLQYEILEEGAGSVPQIRSQVLCHYTGYLLDGTIFDDSIKRGRPEVFYVYELISAWIEALTLMPVGSKWKLYVPPRLGYGLEPLTPESGVNCTLIFEIELIRIIL